MNVNLELMKYEIKLDQKQQRQRVVDGDGLGPVRIGIAIFFPCRGNRKGKSPSLQKTAKDGMV